MPGILHMLDDLGVPYCAATSSSPERAHHSLRAAGLADRFGARVFTVSMVARPKPAPDVYLLAAQRLQLEPSACVVVEDSPAGAAAASAAGMRAILYTPGPASAPAGAGNVRLMHSMDELPGLIAALR